MNKFKPIRHNHPNHKIIRTEKAIHLSSSQRNTMPLNIHQVRPDHQQPNILNTLTSQPLPLAVLNSPTLAHNLITANVNPKGKRFHTQNREPIYNNQVSSLQNYIRDLTTQCKPNPPTSTLSSTKAAGRPNQQRKVFLMRQISFTKFDEEKVASQKKYLTKYKYLSKSLPKMMNTHSELKQATRIHEQKLIECLHLIDKLIEVVKEMEGLGYPIKSNKYMVEYCMKGKPWLKDIFLQESQEKKDVINPRMRKYYLSSLTQIKAKFSIFAYKYEFTNLRLIEEEIEALYDHLEHTLSQKKVTELSNVSNYIEARMRKEGKYIERQLRLTHVDPDKMNLTKDIQNLELKYGAMKEITKISRKRYDQLNRTYEKLQVL